jgi:hypothetical protein
MSGFLFEEDAVAFIDPTVPSRPGQLVLQQPGAVPQYPGAAANIRSMFRDVEAEAVTPLSGGTPPSGLPGYAWHIAPNHHHDFHFRLWVIPPLLQLNNPQLNTDIPFTLWNTWYDEETISAVLVNGSSVLSFDISIGSVINDFQLRTVNMQIAAGEPSIEATVQFVTENTSGFLDVIAAISDTFNLIPDVPIKEFWEFKTDVLTTHKGVEQRIALRRYPRIKQQFTFEIIDLRQRRTQYNVVRKNITVQSLVPMYQYSVNIDRPASIGDFKVFLDNAQSNMRAGDFAIIVNPTTEDLIISRIDTIDLDGITLKSALSFDIDDHWVAAPAINAIVNDGSGIDMRNVTGELQVNADSFEESSLLRPNATRTIDTFDGLPFINRRPLINADEKFNYEREILDNETGARDLNSSWLHPKISGNRKFLIQRIADPDEMDYWRSLFDTVRGGQKSFLLSTFFPDLTPVNPNASVRALSTIDVNEDYYPGLYYAYDTWKRIQIEYPNGTTTQHVVNNATTNPDGSCTVQFSPAIPDTDETDQIKYISFLMKWKASDRVAFRHFANYSEVSFGVFSSDE